MTGQDRVMDGAAQRAELSEFVARGDEAGVRRWIEQAGEATGRLRSGALVAAGVAAGQEKWEIAAALLEWAGEAAHQSRRRLYANLAGLRRCRPGVYATVMQSAKGSRYSVVRGADGAETIVRVAEERGGDGRGADGRAISMSAGHAPLRALDETLRQLGPALDAGKSLAVVGMGDGYLWKHLGERRSALMLGIEAAHFLVEPDAELVLAALMVHDFSGAGGAIEKARMYWCVGGDAMGELARCFEDEVMLQVPQMVVRQAGGNEGGVSELLQRCTAEIIERDAAARARVEAIYRGWDVSELRRAMKGGEGVRKPRALMITTRFSTVLQYCTADSAEGLRGQGWDVRVIIEPAGHLRITKLAVRRVLEEFRPDVVLQIDHHRHEHGDLFPGELPFVCWIQDALPNLNSKEAGRRLGTTDFVMTGLGGFYRTEFDYPAGQIIDAHRYTKSVKRPAAWTVDGEDFVYVSHNSHKPTEVVEALAATFHQEQVRQLIRGCGGALMEVFGRGEHVSTLVEVKGVFKEIERKLGFEIPSEGEAAAVRRRLLEDLFYKLVNPLYRRQSLRWAVAVAKRMGLRVGIYGKGWEGDAEFGEYARGVVKPGMEWEELARRSRFSLKIEPYFCISHQRSLDALVSGGFCLFRRHASDEWMPALAKLVTKGYPGVAGEAELRRVARAEDADVVNSLLERGKTMEGFGDVVEMMRRSVGAGILTTDGEPLPGFAEVSFGNEAELEHVVRRLVAEPGRRDELAETQRRAIEGRLTYGPGLVSVMERMVERLGAVRSGS